ncbi:hypothetical protein AB0D34_28010 [Streptomyces sp. NPDC048420]|uniref:hypothetical protein n=1 Tax=Streptomyces sp. NPDC048420 TaxID=3155755 RepID=UPI00341B3892
MRVGSVSWCSMWGDPTVPEGGEVADDQGGPGQIVVRDGVVRRGGPGPDHHHGRHARGDVFQMGAR